MMPGSEDPCKHQGRRVLLVEGRNDCHVVMALCAAHDFPEIFGVYECGSDILAVKRLNALVSQPDPPEVIGLVLDADDSDATRRWQSVKDRLSHYPYQLPDKPTSSGILIDAIDDKPRLGVWLMPNNADSGMLEDFCYLLAEPEARSFAAECVDKAEAKKVTTFKAAHRSKAVVHTYLAWQDEPGQPLGQAITRQSLRSDEQIALQFIEWLRELFL